jgi:hypothetical protein
MPHSVGADALVCCIPGANQLWLVLVLPLPPDVPPFHHPHKNGGWVVTDGAVGVIGLVPAWLIVGLLHHSS